MFSLISEFTSIFSGLVIFTVLGFMAEQMAIPLEKIVKGGNFVFTIEGKV